MKTSVLFVALFFFATSGYSQEMHPHKHDPSESVGVVRFPVSCKPQAQKQFNRAVAWLHSFEYEEAEKAFAEVTVTDPQCALGYWGAAMSNYHPLWAPPTPEELKTGSDAVEKARNPKSLPYRVFTKCSNNRRRCSTPPGTIDNGNNESERAC